jgi:hypothetical protein
VTQQEAYKLYAAATENPVPLAALNQSYERHGEWWLRGYHCGTVATVDQKTGKVH